MSHLPRTLSALAAALLVAACGLKGPLRSPDDGKEAATPATSTQESTKRSGVRLPAPQAQKKKDNATNQAPAGDTTTPVSPPDPDRPDTSTPPPPQR